MRNHAALLCGSNNLFVGRGFVVRVAPPRRSEGDEDIVWSHKLRALFGELFKIYFLHLFVVHEVYGAIKLKGLHECFFGADDD